MTDALETRYAPTCVIIPNFVSLGQTPLSFLTAIFQVNLG